MLTAAKAKTLYILLGEAQKKMVQQQLQKKKGVCFKNKNKNINARFAFVERELSSCGGVATAVSGGCAVDGGGGGGGGIAIGGVFLSSILVLVLESLATALS